MGRRDPVAGTRGMKRSEAVEAIGKATAGLVKTYIGRVRTGDQFQITTRIENKLGASICLEASVAEWVGTRARASAWPDASSWRYHDDEGR